MFMYKKTLYSQYATSFQINLYIQHNNKNSSILFCAYSQTDFKVSMEILKAQNSQQNPEENNFRVMTFLDIKNYYKDVR